MARNLVVSLGMSSGGTLRPMAASAAAHARPWITAVARFGMGAKGAVYFVVGVVAARSALLHRGKLMDKHEALVEVVRQPLGKWFLLVIALGLLGYVMWRLIEGLLDPEGHGTSAKGLAQRAGYLGIAVIYGGLAVSAMKLFAWGQKPEGEVGKSREMSREVLDLPGGDWLLGAIALGVVIFGIVEIVRAVKGSFMKELGDMSAAQSRWASRIGRVGLIARGLVFGVIGSFGIAAARASDENQVQGLPGALRAVFRTGGGWVLAAVGLGLAAYGVYMFFEARFRRITPP